MPNFEVKSLQTPADAKELARAISNAAYSDEIRAILAAALLSRMTRHYDGPTGRIALALTKAQLASVDLVVAFDRQYQD